MAGAAKRSTPKKRKVTQEQEVRSQEESLSDSADHDNSASYLDQDAADPKWTKVQLLGWAENQKQKRAKAEAETKKLEQEKIAREQAQKDEEARINAEKAAHTYGPVNLNLPVVLATKNTAEINSDLQCTAWIMANAAAQPPDTWTDLQELMTKFPHPQRIPEQNLKSKNKRYLFDLKKANQMTAAYAQVCAPNWNEQTCSRCAKGPTVFKTCITVDGMFSGACANCQFNSSQGNCSLSSKYLETKAAGSPAKGKKFFQRDNDTPSVISHKQNQNGHSLTNGQQLLLKSVSVLSDTVLLGMSKAFRELAKEAIGESD